LVFGFWLLVFGFWFLAFGFFLFCIFSGSCFILAISGGLLFFSILLLGAGCGVRWVGWDDDQD
jgi:hypothetical protein